MPRLRFATARDVFAAYPSAAEDVRGAPTDQPPAAFVQALAVGDTPEDAVTVCAYALDRREVVWWGCQCVRALTPARAEVEAAPLMAAEAWVRTPDDAERRVALRAGTGADRRLPATWLALAAGWSGGDIGDGGAFVAPGPAMTARAVRVAILSALARVPARERAVRLGQCVEGALPLLRHAPEAIS